MGEPIVAERKSNQKLIRLKALDENTDVGRLVDEILDKCKLIHESKRALVEGLLVDLQRQQQHGARAGGARRSRERVDGAGSGGVQGGEPGDSGGEVASLDRLGTYIDACYEGVEHAIVATGQLLQLAREPAQLEPLVNDDRLLGCVTRLLNDEGRRSADLAINIVSVLYALSAYSDFHAALLEFKVGSLVMDVVDLEIKRHALRERERASAPPDTGASAADEARRDKLRLKKQERLLYVCCHVLLNLAEDINTERKMCNHGLLPMLTALLSRHNGDLLLLALAFLRKLSIFGENADEMARARLADKLIAFVPNKHEGVLEQVLHLAYNLAFHPKCAAQLGAAGLSAKLLALLRRGRHRLLAVRLLYMLSARDDEKAKMIPSVPMLVGTVINTPDPSLVPPEVLALLVNLCANADAARACATARGALRGLVALGVRGQHVLALKLLRNLALHPREEHCEELARTYAADVLELAHSALVPDVQLEALGLLADLPLQCVDELPELLASSGALELAAQTLGPRAAAEGDAVLEAVRFVGACAAHAGCAPILARSGRLLPALLDVLSAQQDDDEIVLAAVHAFYRLLCAEVGH